MVEEVESKYVTEIKHLRKLLEDKTDEVVRVENRALFESQYKAD